MGMDGTFQNNMFRVVIGSSRHQFAVNSTENDLTCLLNSLLLKTHHFPPLLLALPRQFLLYRDLPIIRGGHPGHFCLPPPILGDGSRCIFLLWSGPRLSLHRLSRRRRFFLYQDSSRPECIPSVRFPSCRLISKECCPLLSSQYPNRGGRGAVPPSLKDFFLTQVPSNF